MAIHSEQIATIWAQFNQSSVRDSYNVSSVTDNTTGDYTVNFSSNMSNDDYCCLVSARRVAGSSEISSSIHTLATGSARVLSLTEASGGNHDTDTYCIGIFGAA